VEGKVSWGEGVRTRVKVQGGMPYTALRGMNAMINAREQESGGEAFLSGPGGGQGKVGQRVPPPSGCVRASEEAVAVHHAWHPRLTVMEAASGGSGVGGHQF